MGLARLWRFIGQSRYRREIIIVLVLKLILLTVLALTCFSSPIADQLTRMDLVKRFL